MVVRNVMLQHPYFIEKNAEFERHEIDRLDRSGWFRVMASLPKIRRQTQKKRLPAAKPQQLRSPNR
ncbi:MULTISPECIES: hypothetical protein [unclassified Paenibacillus]|uniref:hypothetical protein n=1 Tax=unclassified Paenibacillus TaxID=185978 RepID=UPI001C11CCD6|nr:MULTISPECIES: hypothetical protein [unclassified Paenibacillus]MBU5442360.1 hypothetical protein [Paenibacillus sp. MSJ-34]CAH0121622.1 hypothetical protein PAE9249_04154 [Paenibacillus sp. CECT 9249]